MQEKKNFFQKGDHFFDKLEDKVREKLSHHPILYSLIGGVAIVLWWRGIWMLADEVGLSSLSSIAISVLVMLVTGLFVSFFVGDRIVLSGLKREKKIIEKTEEEIKTEESQLLEIKSELKKIAHSLERFEEREKKKGP